jgi:tRNA (cmo5U34)-methyltransferase
VVTVLPREPCIEVNSPLHKLPFLSPVQHRFAAATSSFRSRFLQSSVPVYPHWVSQFHFTPDEYLDLIRAEVPAFDELQDQVAAAAAGLAPTRILELGTGTGETARRVLESYPEARLTGVDASEQMLAQARRVLPTWQVDELLERGIQAPLPHGPFDLVISALTIHHLDGPAKADLFRRLADVVASGGRFVMGDVVVPKDPADAVSPLSPSYDMPSSTDDLLKWLRAAGFDAQTVWSFKDLVVLRADMPVASR